MARRENFVVLIKTRFDGNQADFARAISRSSSVVWQYLSGHRDIGEKFARHVESKLHLPVGWLDKGSDKDSEVPVSDNVAVTPDEVQMLKIWRSMDSVAHKSWLYWLMPQMDLSNN